MNYWQKQAVDRPLFPDLLWSRPENRLLGGKLLIIGGNGHGFQAPAMAHSLALAAGAGTVQVILPDALRKTVGRVLDNVEFAPSTPSGSFSRLALAEWLDGAAWADAVLLAGDLGRNSETAITIEQFVNTTTSPLIITKDAIDYFYADPQTLLKRPQSVLVLTIAQLQKLLVGANWPEPLTFSMGIPRLTEYLHNLTLHYPVHIVLNQHNTYLVAVAGQISSTPAPPSDIWRVATAANVSVWYMQNLSKPYEALTTAVASAA